MRRLVIARAPLAAASLLFAGGAGEPLAAAEEESEPEILAQVVAVENVCAWPNLTLMPDGEILAVFHNQPAHGTREGDVECWASGDGTKWEKRSLVTRHEPGTVRMNHAAGVAGNGDLVVLCSGWTDHRQGERPKQAPFRDGILRPWVLRSPDGGRTWKKREAFPAPEAGWSEHIPFGDIWIGEDGTLHGSTYQGQFVDEAASTKTKGWRAWHIRSGDDGLTWETVSVLGPRHNETAILPLGEKRWLAAARIDRVELIGSDDDGATWGEPVPVTERNEINGHLARLEDGRLLLSYGVRVEGRRGVCARLSSDEGETWGDVLRISHAGEKADCGYPSSVQRGDGAIVTAWYANRSPIHDGYHLGVTVWRAPAPGAPGGDPRAAAAGGSLPPGKPAQPAEFEHAGVLAVWKDYADRLTFGKGQTLALVDDGCDLSKPEWQAAMPDGVPKVRVAWDAVSGDGDPSHEGRGYHGTTIGIPSSVHHGGKLGVAFRNQVAVIRGNECCHCSVEDSRASLARALQWVIDHHEEHDITTVNLAPVDDEEHAAPVPTEIDAKLAALRELGIWVSAPAGNHHYTGGISWPASQPNCFAIGAVKPGRDEAYLDRHEKVALLVPARATSSSNAIACGSAMILREAIEKTGYDWRADGETLPDAIMEIFRKTGVPVEDSAAKRTFFRLDLAAAVGHVYTHGTK